MIKDLMTYLWENRIWWIAPAVVMFVVVGVLLFVSSSTPVGPFIYALF